MRGKSRTQEVKWLIRFIVNGWKLLTKEGIAPRSRPRSCDVNDWDSVRNWYKLRNVA